MRRHALALAAFASTLAVAAQTAGARSAAPTVAVAGVSAQSFTAGITWDVDRASTVAVVLGAGAEPAVWSKQVTTTGAGRFSTFLTPLEPLTTYRAVVVAVANGQRRTSETTFRTGPMPLVAKGRATPRGLKVNTRPLFPRMVFGQCPWAYPASLAAGINVFMGTVCGTPRQAMGALAGKALLIPDIKTRADGASVIGWHQLDEADTQVTSADVLPLVPPSSKTGRTTFLTLSNHVWSGAAQLPNAATLYPALAARTEFLGTDIYPLQSFCKKELLASVYAAQRELIVLARGMPTFQWIEADPMGVCAGLDPSPAIVRAETWLAIAGGARAIGWFPENWKPAIRKEITALSTEIRSLAPALLGAELPVRVASPSPVLAGAREHNGARYVIAVNPRFGRTSARITLPGLGTQAVAVLGEDRSIQAVGGTFFDRFRGLQARIYVIPPAGF